MDEMEIDVPVHSSHRLYERRFIGVSSLWYGSAESGGRHLREGLEPFSLSSEFLRHYRRNGGRVESTAHRHARGRQASHLALDDEIEQLAERFHIIAIMRKPYFLQALQHVVAAFLESVAPGNDRMPGLKSSDPGKKAAARLFCGVRKQIGDALRVDSARHERKRE